MNLISTYFIVPFLLSLQNKCTGQKSYPKTNLEQFDCHSGKYRLKSGTDPIEKQKRIILKF
jgi:hypothetical protein